MRGFPTITTLRLPDCPYSYQKGLLPLSITTTVYVYTLRETDPFGLYRISAIRNRGGKVVGLTCRVGRAVKGHVDMIADLLHAGDESILFLGRPGVGKTTVIRELARVLSDVQGKRVVIIDTSNEIGGDGDVPHPAIGSARRMQVPNPSLQHLVMIEAVENHTPEIVIVDEIGTCVRLSQIPPLRVPTQD